MTIAANLAAVREAIAGAAPRGHAVEIVGVTKLQPAESVRAAVAAGLRVFGNNYVQEGEKLRAQLTEWGMGQDLEWHFIGHIQSRKAKSLVDYGCVQSLDRIEVARELDKRLTRNLDVLVEVNVGEEAQKSGIAPAELDRFLDELAALSHLRVRGLMTMPPPLEPVEARRPFFAQVRRLFDDRSASRGFDRLSMGTSGDFLVAVQEGATMVRLGTTLFGARPTR